MKKLSIVVLILLLTLISTVQAFAEKPVTTVLDFSVNNVSKNDMKSIISFLSASLYDTGNYRMIDTAQRDTILNELEFSLSGCSDDSCQLEIGKLLSAEYIVTGDVAKVGSRYVLTARMLETETSETRGTAKGIYETLDELIDDMPVFADNLAGANATSTENLIETEAQAVVEAETKLNPADTEPVQTSHNIDGREVIKWSLAGGGVAAVTVGTILIINGTAAYLNSYAAYSNAAAGEDFDALWADVESAIEVRDRNNIIGLSVGAVGLAAAGVAVWMFVDDTVFSGVENGKTDASQLFFRPAPGGISVGGVLRW